jgi:hypothetical protein
MFSSYMFPIYRSPFMGGYGGYPGIGPGYGYGGYPGYGYGYGSTNIIGSAIANQNMNVIGTGAIGGTQIATPTVIW